MVLQFQCWPRFLHVFYRPVWSMVSFRHGHGWFDTVLLIIRSDSFRPFYDLLAFNDSHLMGPTPARHAVCFWDGQLENPSLAINRHESILWMQNDARLQSFICCFASCGLPKSTGAVACNALLGTSIDGMQAPPCAMVRVMQRLNCRLQNCQNCTQAFFNFFEDKPQLPFSSSCIWEWASAWVPTAGLLRSTGLLIIPPPQHVASAAMLWSTPDLKDYHFVPWRLWILEKQVLFGDVCGVGSCSSFCHFCQFRECFLDCLASFCTCKSRTFLLSRLASSSWIIRKPWS